MPTRYTLQQVKSIFESNNCVLLDSEYTNQLQKLNFIATCGHPNCVDLKTFLTGSGLKCKKCTFNIPTYESVAKMFSDKGCVLLITEEEFNDTYTNNRCKLNYVASCGHNNVVSLANFNYLHQGINCRLCVNKNTGEKLKQLRSGENNNSSIEQEFKCILYFTEITKEYFEIKKTFGGCKSDITLRPNSVVADEWIGIQVKSTHKKNELNSYNFKLNNSYENCLIVCICLEDKRMWLIPFEDVKEIHNIKISVTSKYNCYEVTVDNIIDKLTFFYENIPRFHFDMLNIPTSDTQKQELAYRKLREDKIDFIDFIYPSFEGTVYDFIICDKKFQEKVGFICKNNPNSFGFNLSKNNGKHYNCPYELGDNDFYWLHCKNTSRFYVIPESELYEYGFIGHYKQHLYISPNNIRTKWTNEYLFDYDKLDKEKLLQILQI